MIARESGGKVLSHFIAKFPLFCYICFDLSDFGKVEQRCAFELLAGKTTHALLNILVALAAMLPVYNYAQTSNSLTDSCSRWNVSFQYLGITYHPDGGTTPEVYPLKLDEKANFVLNVGVAANLDYNLGKHFFLRFTTSLYKDCAFVTAGCFHLGPRIQFNMKRSRFNLGVGPIFSYREDWHQFPEYTTDDFYGERVSGKWQYRFFPYAVELEYIYRINDRMEFQYSLIPGAPLVFTSLIGLRFKL